MWPPTHPSPGGRMSELSGAGWSPNVITTCRGVGLPEEHVDQFNTEDKIAITFQHDRL